MIGLAILGATGSVGASTLQVAALHPQRFRVVALGARRNVDALLAQIEQHRPDYAALADRAAARELEARVRARRLPTRVLGGPEALAEIATAPTVDQVMCAIVGAAGLASTLAAARAGKRLLLANKEALVMAGELLLAALRAGG
ncbi:MAG: 1-deoxy-D-xylulose-5-phosphate reductoisomerase, partial [Steroidobacteraceae bacterium]|nr:1-deoxy-D-xylulose-5-phosphate reductoisomerase [Steroidobacteraceae bacterium]